MKEVYAEFLESGNSRSFSLLYNKYADMLYAYGMKIVPDDYLVSEAIQSLYVYIYEKRARLQVPDSINAYLCVSLRRILLKEIEKFRQTRHESIEDDKAESYSFELEIDIESALIQSELKKEQLDTLQKALNKLSAKQREAIYLKYYQNMTNEQIAEVMKINNQSVRNLISQSLGSLRKREVASIFINFIIPFI